MNVARGFYEGAATGNWQATKFLSGRDVLLLAGGPSMREHGSAVAALKQRLDLVTIAMNIQSPIEDALIDYRIASHPIRMLVDSKYYSELSQPLITPASMLPQELLVKLAGAAICDFGIAVESGQFCFDASHCTVPSFLVAAYALGVATSGGARRIFLAGFDGYDQDDPRNLEMQALVEDYQAAPGALDLISLTPTRYGVSTRSVYAESFH
jgi:4-hydroxy 2-oxovalerate aldolase